MASRRISRIASLLAVAALLASGCGGGDSAGETTVAGDTRGEITAGSTSTTTIPAKPATTVPPLSAEELPDIGAEVRVPEGEGTFPAVVLVHGGGWVGGAPSLMSDLAGHLTVEGFLTVNARYHLAAARSPGFPAALDDIACAVRYAAAHPRSDGTVAVVGYSAGAHLGAVVALTGDRYAAGCPVGGNGIPSRFVGLAGLYDVSRIGIAAVPFFGGGPEAAAEAWAAGNPQLLTGANPGLVSLLLHGESDGIVDFTHAVEFQRALAEAGSEALLEIVEGARHRDLHDPAFVGDLIVTWLER
jgi:acetyl esterase/lipase